MIKLKVKRLNAGNYVTSYDGYDYSIFSVQTDFGGTWETVWQVKDLHNARRLDWDPYPSKRDAVDDLAAWLEAGNR